MRDRREPHLRFPLRPSGEHGIGLERGRDGRAEPVRLDKAPLIHLTRVLALEFVADHVTVNAIAPGPIDTEMTRDLFRQSPEQRERVLSSIPAGQGQPDEIVAGMLYLLSPEAAFMTGHVLYIDDGMSVTGAHGRP
ncbi:MAG: SDR family oxidoreductase [Candidatus Rokubacteria bacterium]|nr:SDR family oxidoreductase [Candidatus Rokubacteria bacterium]